MAHNIQKCTKKRCSAYKYVKYAMCRPEKSCPSIIADYWEPTPSAAPDPRPHDPGSVSGAEPKDVAKHDAMVIHLSLESDISCCCL